MNKVAKIFSYIAFVFAFCCLAVGYAAVQDTLTVSGSVSVSSYKIVYHTYSAAAGHTTSEEYYPSASTEITVAECPDSTRNSEFLGWTFSGVYTTGFQSNISVYTGGEKVTVQALLSKQGGTGKEVHLYDVYTSYPTLTAKLHPQDKIVGSEGNSANTPFTFKSKVSDSAGTREYEAKTGSNTAVSFVSRKDGIVYKLYYHPGIQVQVVGGSVSGTKAYVTKNSTDKTSTVTSYENLGNSGDTVRYVGLDRKHNDVYIVEYHTYNDTVGDYILDYDEYFGTGTTVTVRAKPTENSFVPMNKWRGWTLTGLVCSTAGDDNVTEYQPGNTVTVATLLSQQFSDGFVCTDKDGDKCIPFFDVYADTAILIGTTHPSDGVSSYDKTMFKVSPAYQFNDASDPYRRFTFSGPDNAWNITEAGTKITFYYHPGIELLGQTNSTDGGNGGGSIFMTLNSGSSYYDINKSWTNPDVNGSEGRGIIYTDLVDGDPNKSLKIKSTNDQGVELKWNGTITVYDVDTGDTTSSGECFAAGTLVTLADGSRIPVEELNEDDILRVYDHENGRYTCAPILFIEYDGIDEYNVINLVFSDGTHTKIIYEHGLFDLDLNKYVYITEANYADLIGHRFAKESDSGYGIVTLEDAYVESEVIGCYSLTTSYYQNYFIDGMFSMPGGITGLFNYFEYGENLAYDQEKMQADIEKYGLYTAEDFVEYLPEEVFDEIYPIKYLKVSVGKGLMTFEDIVAIIERYVYGHGLI